MRTKSTPRDIQAQEQEIPAPSSEHELASATVENQR